MMAFKDSLDGNNVMGEPSAASSLRIMTSEEQNSTIQANDGSITNSDNNSSHDQLTQSWHIWKGRKSFGSNVNRKFSSFDPLKKPEDNSSRKSNDILSEIQSQSTQSQWYNYLNPLSYIPEETFNFQLPDNLRHGNLDNQSTQSAHSTLTTLSSPNTTSWFNWPSFLKPAKSITEPHSHETLNSIELKKNIKDAKKAISNADAVWAWYQNHFNNNISGELSVLNTKTEITPVELQKYPVELQNLPSQESIITPSFQGCFRQITTKTKIRLATELYYNYPTEKHLYIKKNIHKPLIQYILIISVNSSIKKPSINAFQLTELASESMKNWYTDKEISYDYQIETVSLEASKLTNSTLEDLFKLLINWRENFKKIDYVLIAGLKTTASLAASLLNVLISRNLLGNAKKNGLLLMNGSIINPYLEPTEQSNLTYSVEFDMTIAQLIRNYNTKITFVGSLTNIPSTLALHLSHPNIFRAVLLSRNEHENDFESHMFEVLLISSNLGHPSTRLLIQISKYFISQPNTSNSILPSFTECLNSKVFQNAIENSVNSTSLIKKQRLKLNIINDPILENNYNMVWNLHAFINDYKKIKNIDSYHSILQLLNMFKRWDPHSKNLKDLKHMLQVLEIEDYSGIILRPV